MSKYANSETLVKSVNRAWWFGNFCTRNCDFGKGL